MIQEQAISELKSSLGPDAQERLSSNLDSIVKGRKDVIRTPFLKDLSVDDVVSKFEDEVIRPGSGKLNEQLSAIEAAQKQKVGPRSVQKPWTERKDDLLEGFNTRDIPSDLLGDLETLVNGRALMPCSVEVAKKSLRRTTSAGLPFLTPKGKVLDSGLQVELGEYWPCMLYTRTQEQGKTRAVWGYPLSMTILEATYFVPYFEQFKYHPNCCAYQGPDKVDEAVTNIIDRRGNEDTLYSEDYSGFDNSIAPNWSVHEINRIAKAYQQGYSNDFSTISDYFSSCGIVTPDGVYSGPHGIPSGSMFTSVVGSSCHLLAQSAVNGRLQPHQGQVMGDDGVSAHPKGIDLKYLADVYSKFNLTLNEDKTFVSDAEVIYLQRYYSTDYRRDGLIRGIYPVWRALNRLMHMERWTEIETSAIPGADYFAIRAIAILENCKWHPLHYELVKWAAECDKYDLHFSEHSLLEYVRNYQTRSKTGLRHQYSDNLEGIQSFETVKVLRSLS